MSSQALTEKVAEREGDMEMEEDMKVTEDEMEEVAAKTYQYAPAYHYNPVYYPFSSYPTTVTRVSVSAPYYPNLYPNYPRLYPSVVPQHQFLYPQGVVQAAPVVSQPQQVQKLEGEDEAAALAL